MSRYVLVSAKPWHSSLYKQLSRRYNEHWDLINSIEDFTFDRLKKLQPSKVFIPHWSNIIPATIYQNFECIVFHMTDLPFGRGGSPLQNLIVRGIEETKISALRVSEGIDTGDIYLKSELSLNGTAEEIFMRGAIKIGEMIEIIISKNLVPKKQEGVPIMFKRRKPEDGNISNLESIDEVYDFIRMLDCPGYPPAFIETKNLKIDFSRAIKKSDGTILADVRIFKK